MELSLFLGKLLNSFASREIPVPFDNGQGFLFLSQRRLVPMLAFPLES